jgi:hypothetical protein
MKVRMAPLTAPGERRGWVRADAPFCFQLPDSKLTVQLQIVINADGFGRAQLRRMTRTMRNDDEILVVEDEPKTGNYQQGLTRPHLRRSGARW